MDNNRGVLKLKRLHCESACVDFQLNYRQWFEVRGKYIESVTEKLFFFWGPIKQREKLTTKCVKSLKY